METGLSENSPLSLTSFAFGARRRNVTVRSARTSGDTTGMGGGCEKLH
jgi:hypothetical protein